MKDTKKYMQLRKNTMPSGKDGIAIFIGENEEDLEFETAYPIIDGKVAVNAIHQIIHEIADMGYKLI